MSINWWMFLFVLIHVAVSGSVKNEFNRIEMTQITSGRIFANTYGHNGTVWKTNVYFAGGIVSAACLRCMCLFLSDCEPVGCQLVFASKYCGYFSLSSLTWIDCGRPGKDLASCANDITCSSKCIQNYMNRYVDPGNCSRNCEGYSRLLFGGPGGCNNPRTVKSWKALQQVPGCKGVE